MSEPQKKIDKLEVALEAFWGVHKILEQIEEIANKPLNLCENGSSFDAVASILQIRKVLQDLQGKSK